MTISPKTRIGELLEAYPELEKVLIEISPVFEKLRNPILRRTVARVATIQQISVVGGIPVDDIIKRLRKEVGQNEDTVATETSEYTPATPPVWFESNKIAIRFDATPVINSGGSPMNEVLQKSMQLKKDEIFELQTPFVPAPILDMLKSKNFLTYTILKASTVFSYITKP